MSTTLRSTPGSRQTPRVRAAANASDARIYTGLASDERLYTSNFYKEVIGHQIIHYGRVNESLYVGSCPRSLAHISTDLSERLGITAVINLQELPDMEVHCQDIITSGTTQPSKDQTDLDTILSVRSAYEQANIVLDSGANCVVVRRNCLGYADQLSRTRALD